MHKTKLDLFRTYNQMYKQKCIDFKSIWFVIVCHLFLSYVLLTLAMEQWALRSCCPSISHIKGTLQGSMSLKSRDGFSTVSLCHSRESMVLIASLAKWSSHVHLQRLQCRLFPLCLAYVCSIVWLIYSYSYKSICIKHKINCDQKRIVRAENCFALMINYPRSWGSIITLWLIFGMTLTKVSCCLCFRKELIITAFNYNTLVRVCIPGSNKIVR